MSNHHETKPLGKVVYIDESGITDHSDHLVRGRVEETLNALLDIEAATYAQTRP